MGKKYKNTLLRLLPIFLVVLVTIGLSELFYQSMVKRTTDNCWEEINTARNEAAREISIRFNNDLKMLSLAADAIVLNADFEDETAVRTYLNAVKEKSIFDRIDVIYPDGTVKIQSGAEQAEVQSGKPYAELIANGTHLSRRMPDPLSGKESIFAFAPVYNDREEPIAILSAAIHCASLADSFVSVYYGESAQLFLVDLRDGNLILDKWHETPGNISDILGYTATDGQDGESVVREIMAGRTGRISYASQTYDNTSYTVYAPVPNTNFSMVMVVQEDVVFAQVENLKDMMTWVAVVELVVLLLFTLWIYFFMRQSSRNANRAQEAELALLHQKERQLQSQYEIAANRQEFLEIMAINLPGGYHRCTTAHNLQVTFVSNSFTQVTGYTLEQLKQELDGGYLGIVAPEEREYFCSLFPQLERDGFIHCAYRIRRRDGQIRWVKDTTQRVGRGGEEYYQCALVDITEQIEEIQRARQAAEASSQAKSTFLFNISHDIRTPMNAIQGFSHIIDENAENPQLVRQTVAKIHQAGNSLMMLMNDVLDIARIERGKDNLNLRPVNLYEHGKNLYEMFAADMQEAGICFLGDGDSLDDDVYCDELKLTRVMMNMLSNAKKFTPRGGTVTFGGSRIRQEGDFCTYRFFVRDTGIGMSKEFQKRAFEQFERERTSTESGVAGSGLGLAIIKMLSDLMGGTIELHSEPGKGTEIALTLTLQKAETIQEQKKQAQHNSLPDISGKRVLLVEDNSFNREIARYILEGMQLIVEEAENGAVCLDKLLSSPAGYYDLILMDIQMPVMDGYMATTEIRNLEDPQRSGVPIVAMTANAFEEDKRKCMEIGMNGHIGKPIDMEALMQVLSGIIA